MISSYVDNYKGLPTLFVNGKPYPSCAYMTYLEEYNNYSLFSESGYSMFSVPVLFSGRWISVTDGMKPFHSGIFDNKDCPDFSSFNHSVSLVLESCPNALIFPRINMSMPSWWIEENPDCLDSTGNRELLCNEKWKEDAGRFLEIFLKYLVCSDYSEHIVGLQLAGGNTEEWFYFDLNGGYCENEMHSFKKYLSVHYPKCDYSGLPDISPLSNENSEYHGSDYLRYYIEFINNSVAESVSYFASIAKKVTEGRLAVGTFYGYSLEVSSSLWGTHALKRILECNNIDFICSPNSYIGTRSPDYEWTEMFPADSVRLHGKLCMQECDIRTHLTKFLSDCAPEYDTHKKMNSQIWRGLESKSESFKMIRKCFDRQLKKGNGMWWFDMWGGWYNDPDIINEMKLMLEEYKKSFDKTIRKTKSDIAVFVDENAYSYIGGCRLRYAPYSIRKELGQAFDNYDMYDVFDFDSVKDKYAKFVFLSGQITTDSRKAVRYCKDNGIPFLCNSFENEKFTLNELKQL